MNSDHIDSSVVTFRYMQTCCSSGPHRDTTIFPVCVWFIVGILQGRLGGRVGANISSDVFCFFSLTATRFWPWRAAVWCFLVCYETERLALKLPVPSWRSDRRRRPLCVTPQAPPPSSGHRANRSTLHDAFRCSSSSCQVTGLPAGRFPCSTQGPLTTFLSFL